MPPNLNHFNNIKKPTRKLKIKHIKPHTNFAEEIYQQQKTDKFFNRILTVGYIICAICAIILIIVNIK